MVRVIQVGRTEMVLPGQCRLQAGPWDAVDLQSAELGLEGTEASKKSATLSDMLSLK